MRKPSKNQATSVLSPKALLERYACPLPYHQVRARFMGSIATPDMTVSPMQEIQRVWNDDLPVFKSTSEAEEFFGGLFQGVWNALSAHQKRTDPFKLARLSTAPANLEFLARFSRVRREEIEGFVDGLFANKDEMDLPASAHKAVSILGQIRSLFAAAEQLATSPAQPASVSSITETIKHFQQMSRIAEHEINVVIQSCKKARAQALEMLPMDRPPILH